MVMNHDPDELRQLAELWPCRAVGFCPVVFMAPLHTAVVTSRVFTSPKNVWPTLSPPKIETFAPASLSQLTADCFVRALGGVPVVGRRTHSPLCMSWRCTSV